MELDFKEFKELVMPAHSAVIVLDIQNDICHPEGICAKIEDISLRQKAAHNIVEFIKEARKYKAPIIFIKTNHSKWNDSPSRRRRRKVSSRPENCLEGTWGEKFYMVQPLEGDPIVVKHRFSAFMGTDLNMILRSTGITTLIVTGVGTGACVESTVRDGCMLDYDIVVVSDCCGTAHIEEHESALRRMERSFGTVVESRKLLEAWCTL